MAIYKRLFWMLIRKSGLILCYKRWGGLNWGVKPFVLLPIVMSKPNKIKEKLKGSPIFVIILIYSHVIWRICENHWASLNLLRRSAGPQPLRISLSLAMAEFSVKSFTLFMWWRVFEARSQICYLTGKQLGLRCDKIAMFEFSFSTSPMLAMMLTTNLYFSKLVIVF